MNLILTYCTNFNGIHMMFADVYDKVSDETKDKLNTTEEDIASLCEFTLEADGYLSQREIEELIHEAKKIVDPVIPNCNITFQYDHHST